MKKALVIGTEIAVSEIESGASIRLNSIKKILSESGFEVIAVSKKNADSVLKRNWDIIVLVSFSSARFLRKSRKKTKILWFDPTDSWSISRLSIGRSGDLRQFFALFLDCLFIYFAPKIDQITFITSRDMLREKFWWKFRKNPIVLPNSGLRKEIKRSNSDRLIFVGEGSYKPNLFAIKFLKDVLDHLPKDIKIYLYGKNLSDKDPRFIINGYAQDSEIYLSNNIYLAPINFGAGQKMKVAVPLWNGLQVIATGEAAAGFNKVSNLLVANSPNEFALEIKKLFNNSIRAISPAPEDLIYERNQMAELKSWLESIGNSARTKRF